MGDPKILNYISDHASVNGWAGRNLYRLLKQAGLVEINAIPVSVILTDFSVAGPILHLESAVREMVEEGDLSADEAGGWLGYLRQADETGYFFSAMTGFMACGHKPCPTPD